MDPLSSLGQSYKGFCITKYLELKELQSTLMELVHEASGARVMHIANDDPENLFCLSLQTLPESSNGIAHILEHTVLCGSKKFPVKDPFFSMTRRSLNTYMNALTGQDFTCYPASSQVEKDFYNLLEVYLDAVFHPELKKLSFLQEGHRLEIIGGKLQFQGVVYNEMKGAMSSIESRLWEAIAQRLVPDLPYAHNSGGDPKDIPTLSYEELIEFHKNFYHPSRCLFFFYGNLPLTKHLDFIRPTLEHTNKIPPLPLLKKQTRFFKPVEGTERYPIAKGESLEKKTQLAFAFLTTEISNQSEILALSVLESILCDTDASPLTMALLKSESCTQIDSSLDVEMSEIPWVIVCRGCEEKDAQKIEEILFETLRNVEISQEEIEASLHQLEFQRTEIGAEGIPFGLSLFMRAGLIKQHGSEPENALLIHSLFDNLRAKLKNPHYLKDLIRKYLLENPHRVRLVFKPDPNLEEEEQKEEEKQLDVLSKKLSLAQKEEIEKQTKQLAHYQETVENQSLDCLPKVTLKDVPKKIRDYPLIDRGFALHHACFTNQILYTDLIFEMPELSPEDLILVSLFAKLLPELGSGGRNYQETLKLQQSYIGGFDASLGLHVTQEDPNQCRPTFSLRGKALYRNGDKLFQLFADFINSPDLDDKERIQEWLEQHVTDLQERFTKNSLNYAVQTSLSGLSIPSYIYNQWCGLPYYNAVLKWAKACDETFFKSLKRIATTLLGVETSHLVITCDEDHYQTLEKANFYHLKLPKKPYIPWKGHYKPPKQDSEAKVIASPVAFTALGMRTISYKDPDSPYLLISTELMENLILHKEIREKGGAYGGGATYTPSTGNFHFYAYRDPNLSKSICAFDKAIEQIALGKFNERELEEAKLGVLQSLDAPLPPGNRAMTAYAWKRAGRTPALREEFRRHVIEADPKQIQEAVSRSLFNKERVLVSFLGQELLAKEQQKLEKPLRMMLVD